MRRQTPVLLTLQGSSPCQCNITLQVARSNMGHSCIWVPSAICKGESRWWTHCRRAVCNVHRQMPGQVCGCSTEADSESVCGFDSRPRKRVIAITVGGRVLVNPTEDKHDSCWMTITRARASTWVTACFIPWDVAKFGIALDLGSRDHRFESCHSNYGKDSDCNVKADSLSVSLPLFKANCERRQLWAEN